MPCIEFLPQRFKMKDLFSRCQIMRTAERKATCIRNQSCYFYWIIAGLILMLAVILFAIIIYNHRMEYVNA